MPTGCYLELYDKNKKLSYRWQTARCICADHLKPHLSLTCVTIPHMVILCQTVWALVGEGCLKIWVRWGPAILGWGLVNLLKTRPSPICGITPHLVVLIKGFEHTYMGCPKFGHAWAPPLGTRAVPDPLQTVPSPHGLTCHIWSLLVKQCERTMEICRKIWIFMQPYSQLVALTNYEEKNYVATINNHKVN